MDFVIYAGLGFLVVALVLIFGWAGFEAGRNEGYAKGRADVYSEIYEKTRKNEEAKINIERIKLGYLKSYKHTFREQLKIMKEEHGDFCDLENYE